jgi:hypothetical protein
MGTVSFLPSCLDPVAYIISRGAPGQKLLGPDQLLIRQRIVDASTSMAMYLGGRPRYGSARLYLIHEASGEALKHRLS